MQDYYKDHCLDYCQRIKNTCFAEPPLEAGLQSLMLCQRIHEAEGKAGYPKADRHHVSCHGVTVVVYCGYLCLGRLERTREHKGITVVLIGIFKFGSTFGKTVTKCLCAVNELGH